jgi:hypothetical protein
VIYRYVLCGARGQVIYMHITQARIWQKKGETKEKKKKDCQKHDFMLKAQLYQTDDSHFVLTSEAQFCRALNSLSPVWYKTLISTVVFFGHRFNPQDTRRGRSYPVQIKKNITDFKNKIKTGKLHMNAVKESRLKVK